MRHSKHHVPAPVPRAFYSMLWSALDTVGTLVVGIVSVLVIARLIGEEAFGLGAIALGIVLILFVAIGSLVHDALIRQQQFAAEDLDTAFAASLFSALGATGLMVLLAPTLGGFLDEPRLIVLIWAFLPLLILTAVSTPLMAARRRALDFKTVGRCQLTGRLIGMGAGLLAALSGAGVWSLVAQHLSAAAYVAGTMLFLAPRWPRLHLSWSRLRPMLGFCSPIILSQMLSQCTGRLLIISMGYWHGLAAAGYWGVATRLSESLTAAATQATYNVAVAHMARMQGCRRRLIVALEKAQNLLMLSAVPVLVALASAADPLITLLLGTRWAPTEYLLLGALPGALVVVRQLLLMTALRVVGRSSVSLVSAAATLLAAGLGLLSAGSLAPMAIAVVCSLSPLAGYAVVTFMIRREFGRPVIREGLALLRDLACGVIAFLLGSGLASLLPDGAPLLRIATAAGVGSLSAFTMLAVAQPKMTRRWVKLAGGVVRTPAILGLQTGVSASERLAPGLALRRRGP